MRQRAQVADVDVVGGVHRQASQVTSSDMAMTASSCVVISLAESRTRCYRKMFSYLYHHALFVCLSVCALHGALLTHMRLVMHRALLRAWLLPGVV